MPLFVHAMARAFGVHGEPVELTGESYGEIADVDHLLDLAFAFCLDLAGLPGHQRAEVCLARSEGVTELTHVLSADGSGNHPPGREAFLRGAYDCLVVGLRRLAHGCDDLAIRRGYRRQERAPGLGDPVGVEGSGVGGLDSQTGEELGHGTVDKGRALGRGGEGAPFTGWTHPRNAGRSRERVESMYLRAQECVGLMACLLDAVDEITLEMSALQSGWWNEPALCVKHGFGVVIDQGHV